MAYQTPITVREAIEAIWQNQYVLPAIQREFVWKPDQICRLFDSLMQGFPVGSFLFWKIEKATTGQFTFYGFVRDYHERDQPYCPPLGAAPQDSVTAVLDGQQRLTALNIGLRGSIAKKAPYKRWNNPDAFPKTQLYLDLGKSPDADERSLAYKFEFLTETQAKNPAPGEIWFRVRDVYDMRDPYAVITFLSASGLASVPVAVEKLSRLQKTIHVDPVIAFYQEKDQEIEKVLNIFIRTNSGGTVLSYSDLLLSIASSQWQERDARQEIRALVEDLNDTRHGFNFSKDFVLKAGLMIADIGSVGFKVINFNRRNMQVLETEWERVSKALKLTADLVGSFGISRDNLRADSSLLPIAYYLAMREFDWSFVSSSAHACDRKAIKSWLIRSLIKPGVWGSGLDVLLTDLRKIISTHGVTRFPASELEASMHLKGKSLRFSDEEIEALLDIRYGHRELFGLLTLLFPFVDTASNHFHIDHIFPKALFHTSALRRAEMGEDEIAEMQTRKDQLPNLQLLPGIPNQEKNASPPLKWLAQHIPDLAAQQDYVDRHGLENLANDVLSFSEFFDKRRRWLKQNLVSVLSKH